MSLGDPLLVQTITYLVSILITIMLLCLCGFAIDHVITRCLEVSHRLKTIGPAEESERHLVAERQKRLADDNAGIAEVRDMISSRRAEIAEIDEQLYQMKRRKPQAVFVVNEPVDPADRPWLAVMGREGRRDRTGVDPTAAEWENGRPYLVYGPDDEAAIRRLDAKFPAARGYRRISLEPHVVS
jgi:hypothetical protein